MINQNMRTFCWLRHAYNSLYRRRCHDTSHADAVSATPLVDAFNTKYNGCLRPSDEATLK